MTRRVFSERAENAIAEAYWARVMGATSIGNAWGISAESVRTIARKVRRKREAQQAGCQRDEDPNGAIAIATIHIPGLRLQNPLNTRVHWRVLSRRGKEQKEAVAVALLMADWSVEHNPTEDAPWRVVITRLGPRTMDDDSVVSSAKHVRDAVAKFIGVDDRHMHIVRYEYFQKKARDYGVRIEIYE